MKSQANAHTPSGRYSTPGGKNDKTSPHQLHLTRDLEAQERPREVGSHILPSQETGTTVTARITTSDWHTVDLGFSDYSTTRRFTTLRTYFWVGSFSPSMRWWRLLPIIPVWQQAEQMSQKASNLLSNLDFSSMQPTLWTLDSSIITSDIEGVTNLTTRAWS